MALTVEMRAGLGRVTLLRRGRCRWYSVGIPAAMVCRIRRSLTLAGGGDATAGLRAAKLSIAGYVYVPEPIPEVTDDRECRRGLLSGATDVTREVLFELKVLLNGDVRMMLDILVNSRVGARLRPRRIVTRGRDGDNELGVGCAIMSRMGRAMRMVPLGLGLNFSDMGEEVTGIMAALTMRVGITNPGW